MYTKLILLNIYHLLKRTVKSDAVSHWRCGGSLVEAVVPGSNRASLTMEETPKTGMVTVCIVKSQGKERETSI